MSSANFNIRKASRKKAKIKLGIQGPSGSGKTFSALLLAYGLCGDWGKVVLVDTENGSGDLYSHLGDYNILPMKAPFTPERFIEAIEDCENAGMEAIILDSISHEWDGDGGILHILDGMTGNSFTNWGKVTPRHNKFVNKIINSEKHIICCIRSKQDYIINQVSRNGRVVNVPQKVGLKGVQREGLDYELTLMFDLDINHQATASKDRTSIFMGNAPFVITHETGGEILQWCNEGEADTQAKSPKVTAKKKEMTATEAVEMIDTTMNVNSLNMLFRTFSSELQKDEGVIDAAAKHKQKLLSDNLKAA